MNQGNIVEIDFASESDVAAIVQVLGEGASWMEVKRSSAWKRAEIGSSFVAPMVARSEFVTAKVDQEIAGVCALTRVDRLFWPEDSPGEAAYLL